MRMYSATKRALVKPQSRLTCPCQALCDEPTTLGLVQMGDKQRCMAGRKPTGIHPARYFRVGRSGRAGFGFTAAFSNAFASLTSPRFTAGVAVRDSEVATNPFAESGCFFFSLFQPPTIVRICETKVCPASVRDSHSLMKCDCCRGMVSNAALYFAIHASSDGSK